MWLIAAALRRPVTVLVGVAAIALLSGLALTRMKADIFPNLNLPVIYVAQPYGGMDPSQMEGYLVYYYEYHFLYITGIEHVESRSIQNVGLLKLFFHPDTDMSQALAQTVSYVERARAFMPPGTVAPFVVRFDAGSVPVGELVFSSETRGVGEIQDLALNRVRPTFATLPGVSAPPPFGGNQRTVVIHVDPDRLRAFRMSADEVVKAIASGNTIQPAGNVRTGDLNRLAPVNSVVSRIQELADLPVRTGSGATVYVRDVGTVENSSDILAGYGLVNGRRTVYIPVTKRADASTLDVVARVKAELPRMQALIPEDIKLSFEFDQSTYVRNAIRGLALEGILGSLLTGLMVLLFLRDLRSAFIVVVTIPFALLGSLVGLWLTGQTINIMTLGGLALAVGILVDEATVTIENIHSHLARGESRYRAVFAAAQETVTPRLLAMLSILAVFVPSFVMTGVARSLFIPLSLSVGFSMLASYILSNSLVPVMSAWLLHEEKIHDPRFFAFLRSTYAGLLARVFRHRSAVAAIYTVLAVAMILLVGPRLGTDIFPTVDTGKFQLRMRAPTGTRVERTEVLALKALEEIRAEAGPNAVEITLGYVGTQPTSYPVNTIHLWTSGPHEAMLLVSLRPESGIRLAPFREKLRRRLPEILPDTKFTFEPGDVVSQVMNFGSPTPIEVVSSGPNLDSNRVYAAKIMAEIQKIGFLRDVQYGQPLDYPTLQIDVDRERAGQLGVTVDQVARSIVSATSSSRFIQPNYWRDASTGISYQVQVEVPQSKIQSIEDMRSVPAMPGGASRPIVGDVAQMRYGTMPGEYDRYNQQRMVTITANIAGTDLGTASSAVSRAIRAAGDPPRGVSITVRGQVPVMNQTLLGLGEGLAMAIAVIFLLLAANFQSTRMAATVLAMIPAVIAGVVLALWLTGTTLNVQSFMGAIMAIGVSVANGILLVTVAEHIRHTGKTAESSAAESAAGRLRPILMTSCAMIAGMIPLALAVGEGGDQTAPLGRAVIGGLAASTLAVLLILPAAYSIVQGKVGRETVSLHPDDHAGA